MKTGQLIRELRLKKGFTQEELSAKTEISVRTIQRIENGEVDPRAYTLQTIADALEVEFGLLFNAEPDRGQSTSEGTTWLAWLHLSGLLVLIIPPVLIWIWKRGQIAEMNRHAIDVINFQLSMMLYMIPCILLSIFPVLLILVVYSQVIIIINTVKAANGQLYKYALTIRFLKQGVTSGQASPQL